MIRKCEDVKKKKKEEEEEHWIGKLVTILTTSPSHGWITKLPGPKRYR